MILPQLIFIKIGYFKNSGGSWLGFFKKLLFAYNCMGVGFQFHSNHLVHISVAEINLMSRKKLIQLPLCFLDMTIIKSSSLLFFAWFYWYEQKFCTYFDVGFNTILAEVLSTQTYYYYIHVILTGCHYSNNCHF